MKQMESSFPLENSELDQLISNYPEYSEKTIQIVLNDCNSDYKVASDILAAERIKRLKADSNKNKKPIQSFPNSHEKTTKPTQIESKRNKKITSPAGGNLVIKKSKDRRVPEDTLNRKDLFLNILKSKAPEFSNCDFPVSINHDNPQQKIGYYISIFVKNVYHHPNLSGKDYARFLEHFCSIPPMSIAFTLFDPLNLLEVVTHLKYQKQIINMIPMFPITENTSEKCSTFTYAAVFENMNACPQYALDSASLWKQMALCSLYDSSKNNHHLSLLEVESKPRCRHCPIGVYKSQLI